jgi:hypothetical protein
MTSLWGLLAPHALEGCALLAALNGVCHSSQHLQQESITHHRKESITHHRNMQEISGQ